MKQSLKHEEEIHKHHKAKWKGIAKAIALTVGIGTITGGAGLLAASEMGITEAALAAPGAARAGMAAREARALENFYKSRALLSKLRVGPNTFGGALKTIARFRRDATAAFTPAKFSMRLNLMNAGLAARANATLMAARNKMIAGTAAAVGAFKRAGFKEAFRLSNRTPGLAKWITRSGKAYGGVTPGMLTVTKM